MSDKELIKKEVERIEQILDDFNKTHNNTIDNGIVSAKKNICKHIKSFIDSLPEEPASEDLENVIMDNTIMYASRKAGIKSFAETYSFNIESVLFNQLTLEQQELWRKEIENAVINGGEMGLELADDKRYEERASNEDLEEAAYKYCEKVNHRQTDIITDSFKAGAEWQKQRDQESIELAEYHAMLAGMEKMREEMLKNTVLETKVMKDSDGDGIEIPYEEWLTLENTEIPYIPDNLGLKEGDKVKIIICKGE